MGICIQLTIVAIPSPAVNALALMGLLKYAYGGDIPTDVPETTEDNAIHADKRTGVDSKKTN